MQRAIVSIVAGLCWIAPAQAQSSLLDFSKPMTGKSRYVHHSDGTPVDMGAPARTATQPAHQPGALSSVPASASAPATNRAPAVTLMSTSSNAYSMGPTSMQVQGYTRPDGTYVAPYLRTAPYPR
jgi:hypothetical protein